MHILGLTWHSKFSPASVFSSIKPQKNSKQKNNSTPFEAHMQETMQHIGSKAPQDSFFSSKVSLISFPIKDENLENTGTKNPWQKVT